MTTKLFLRNTVSDYHAGGGETNLAGGTWNWHNESLSTSAGSSLQTRGGVSTVTGPTNGIEMSSGSGGSGIFWYSAPLAAAITISGSITWNLWSSENNMSANVSIEGRLEVVDGATGTATTIDTTAHAVEVAVTTRAVNNFAKTPAAGIACKKGDRLRVRIFGDDVGATNMASGFTFDFSYNGATGAADGDSFLTLTENLTFVSEPAGTTIYPTNTNSVVSTASLDKEAWTSRGVSSTGAVTNTVAGFTAPVQVTFGGAVVDWFTRPLTAFTLGQAVRVNARGSEGTVSANASLCCEIARVANDGTGATVWGLTTTAPELTASEAAYSFLVSGDDLAVTAGQRLRIRFYIDDAGQNAVRMASGDTVTLNYGGPTGGSSGDTYLTFTQTLTEAPSGYQPRNAAVNHQNPGVL